MRSGSGRLLMAGAFIALLAHPGALRAQDQDVGEMSKAVWQKIKELPQYGVFDYITFRIRKSNVTLNGYAMSAGLKAAAEQAVKEAPGVGKIKNRISLLRRRNDDTIRAAVYARIYGHAELQEYNPHPDRKPDPAAEPDPSIAESPPKGPHPIHIIVQGGRVTLEGVVADYGDRAIAAQEALESRKVVGVTNNLDVVLGNLWQRK